MAQDQRDDFDMGRRDWAALFRRMGEAVIVLGASPLVRADPEALRLLDCIREATDMEELDCFVDLLRVRLAHAAPQSSGGAWAAEAAPHGPAGGERFLVSTAPSPLDGEGEANGRREIIRL